jgi:hypothetical protein
VEQTIRGIVINNMKASSNGKVCKTRRFLLPLGVITSYWDFNAMKEHNKFHLPKQYIEDD